MGGDTAQRKDSHLDLCAREQVEPDQTSTLFSCVQLVHCALPELSLDQLELGCQFLGKRLAVPILITGMTGGTDRAEQVNKDLAQLAEKHGLAFGVGSQRAMVERPERARSFQMRDVAPTTVILGNLGLGQALEMGADKVRRMVEDIGADGLALHLNPAQELTQPEGDRDFRRGEEVVKALVQEFGDRLLVKETGCGLSPDVAGRLAALGVKNLDVSGAGGTSWVRVEQLRAQGLARQVGETFSGWGIPTAAAVATVRKRVGRHVTLVAAGGMRNGLDAAKAFALGADLAGLALPLFRAQQEGGIARAEEQLQVLLTELRHAMLLTGSRTLADLRQRPRVITGQLKDWLAVL